MCLDVHLKFPKLACGRADRNGWGHIIGADSLGWEGKSERLDLIGIGRGIS